MNLRLAAIREHLIDLYGEESGMDSFHKLARLLDRSRHSLPLPHDVTFNQRSAILITYADMVREDGRAPLATLADFLKRHVGAAIPAVHLLPFFPSSSDDGFSVIDYKSVDPGNGEWADIRALARDYDLMFDGVINHISAHSAWFEMFLRADTAYRDYFITVRPGTDLSQVFRPRTLPLLTAFDTLEGQKQVWTTFSEDQVDLNYRNPEVLLDIIEVLLFYVQQGAIYIRLDAIAFLWKTPGTRCLHLPQTHRVIQLFRLIFDEIAPQTVIVTETNVPHEENISYFGNGENEAQIVYNFSLPPLVLHAVHQGDASVLTGWTSRLAAPAPRATFLNFLASHDGIGLTPAHGLLSPTEIEALVSRSEALGGKVSYRSNPDGSRSAYELNINYLDALRNPDRAHDRPEHVAGRFLLSQSILLALRGVPGIYFHSLFGSRGWPDGVELTGRKRTINREKVQLERVEADLNNPKSLRSRVFYPYLEMLRLRGKQERTAFSPQGEQEVLEIDERVFALRRSSPDGRDTVWCLSNVSDQPLTAFLNSTQLGAAGKRDYLDLIRKARFPVGNDGGLSVPLGPYQAVWLV
jgi:sucrose phosphorylase